jgi:DeoR family fructose operon transcriptional repressor
VRPKKHSRRQANVYGLAEKRREQIIQYLESTGFATAAELAGVIDVSEATIRRDLAELKSRGRIRRVHGGAALSNFMADLETRKKRFIQEKKGIGRKAAGFVEEGDTVFIDGGSTTEEMAKYLTHTRVRVITNALNVANILAEANGVEVIVVGGNVYSPGEIMLGPITEETISRLKADKAFISVEGIDGECISNSNTLVIGTERAMMKMAEAVFILADHSKFGKRALARLADLDEVDYIIAGKKVTKRTFPFLRGKRAVVVNAR